MTTDTDAVPSAMDQLSAWLRSEADRHMTSIAWRDPAISEHALNLRKWANEIDSRRASTPSAQEEAVRVPELSKELANIIHDLTVSMQSAIIEWQHGKGAEAAFSWIVNTLEGPGHLPDFDAPYGKQAQFWFDANRAEPFPKCFCGNPSHMLWMGQGFCCDAHYDEAKAKRDAAPAASAGDQEVGP